MKLNSSCRGISKVSRVRDSSDLLRPTTSRVKRALFSMIAVHLEGARVLDLFAGSGALGMEAIQQGSSSVDFVERSRKIANSLRANLYRLGMADRTRVFCLRVEQILEKLDGKYELILMDPPYNYPGLTALVERILTGTLLRRTGYLVVEHFKGMVLQDVVGGFSIEKARRYGDTAITIYGPGGP